MNAEHKLYHCFGCGASGDAISFVQETEGLDFKQSVELLGERYNVELKLEKEDPAAERKRQRRERLLKLVERVATYYERYLWESGEAKRAREYLDGTRARGADPARLPRGLRAERLGQGHGRRSARRLHARGDRGRRARRSVAAGAAGSTTASAPASCSRWWTSAGSSLGFGGRAVREDQRPKYVNTAEGELYQKSRQLFGVDRARGQAAKAGRVVVVEGYTDVLALHQAGISETVAIMGTALTSEQLAQLSKMARSVFLALDADPSGQDAMLRASRQAASQGVELRVIDMPEGTDPAELVAAQGAEAFTGLLDSASSVIEFQVRRVLADSDLGTPRGRDRALEEVRPLIDTIAENTATRDELVRFVADRLDVPPSYLKTQLATGPRAAAEAAPVARDGAPRRAPTASIDVLVRAERTFLAMCLAQGEVGREYLRKTGDSHLSSEALRRVRDHLLEHFDDPLAQLPDDDPAIVATITGVVMLADEEPSSEPALRLGFQQLELRRIERDLRHAEKDDDFDRQRQLWSERETVRQGISHLMGEAP